MSYDPLFNDIGRVFGIEPRLLKAIATAESSLSPNAIRFEPAFNYLKDVEVFAKQTGVSVDTERMLQRCSFGLVQIMGGTARDLGYSGPLAAFISDPAAALSYGARYLVSLYSRYGVVGQAKGWAEPVVAAYNAGSARKGSEGKWENEGYVRRVEKIYKSLAQPMSVDKH